MTADSPEFRGPERFRPPLTPSEVRALGARLHQREMDERRRARARNGELVTQLVILLVGISVPFQVQGAGRLYVSELILVAALPFVLTQRDRIPLPDSARWLLALISLWLAAQMLSDAVNGTATADILRGWARPLFFAANFTSLFLLLRQRPSRIILAGAALGLGLYLDYVIAPTSLQVQLPWKFGLAFPITLAAAVLATTLYARGLVLLAGLTLAALSPIHLLQGSRSLAALCFLAGAYVVLSSRLGVRRRASIQVPLRVAVVALGLGIVATWGFVYAYEWAAAGGYLGQQAQALYDLQGEGSFGVIVGGRPNIYEAYLAIQDAPWVGHGSWAQDDGARYYLETKAFLEASGYVMLTPFNGLIDAHSFILGAWVEAGMTGTLPWLFVLGLAVRHMLLALLNRSVLVPLAGLAGAFLLWDVLFSPFAGVQRLMVAYYLCVLLASAIRPGSSTTTDQPGALRALRRVA